MSDNIQRWSIRQRDDHSDYMATNDAGDWVKYEDYTRKRDALQAELKAASERSETLRKERDDFREKWQYENARRRDDEGVWLATRDANKELTEKRDALQATVDAKWSYRLTTPPPPDPPGISYPNLSETYKLEVIDTGHSDRILLLESKELSERIKQLEATVEKCRAAGEWREAKHTDTFSHGDLILAAVKIHPLGQQPHWEIGLVRFDSSDNRMRLREMSGNEWRWYWDDVRFWMPVKTPSAAERAKGVEVTSKPNTAQHVCDYRCQGENGHHAWPSPETERAKGGGDA